MNAMGFQGLLQLRPECGMTILIFCVLVRVYLHHKCFTYHVVSNLTNSPKFLLVSGG